MTQTIFSWLHLSDIHANHGNAQHHANQQKVLTELIRDLPNPFEKFGAPQPRAIFVTGDIAFSGDAKPRTGASVAEEYARAKTWLLDVAGSLKVEPKAIFCVPGNHDVARTDTKKGTKWHTVKALRRGDTEIDAGLTDGECEPLLRERLRAYLSFCEHLNPVTAKLDSWTHTIALDKGPRIRIVGLNTALLCNDEEDKGHLYLGESQLRAITHPAKEANEVILTMSHHPLEGGWLADEKNAANWIRNHAHIHISGHEHRGRSRDIRHGAGPRHVLIDAGAVHEDARPRGESYSHAYNISALVLEDDGRLLVRIWPRRWVDTKAGFAVDTRGVDEPNSYAEHELGIRLESITPTRREAELAPAIRSPDDTALQMAERRFREIVIQRYGKLTVRMPSAEPVELPLEEIYVDLKVIAEIPRTADTFSVDERRIFAELEGKSEAERVELWQQYEALKQDRWRSLGRTGSSLGDPRSILELLAEPGRRTVVLLGDPGSGKSTLLHLLAIRAAGERGLLGAVEKTSGDAGAMLPILVPLAAYDAHCEKTKTEPSLREYLAIYWSKQQFRDAVPLFERALDEGRALVLLDGLDEVMSSATRSFVVKQVDALIRNAAPGNRFVVTSRFVGYRQARLSEEFDHVSVLDFGDREIELFLQRWCEVLEARVSGGASEATRARAMAERDGMRDEIKGNAHLLALAKNPLQLGMLALLRRQHTRLPKRRVQIFEEFTKMLLELRPEVRSEGARVDSVIRHSTAVLRRHIRALALWMQQHHPSRTAGKREVLAVLEATWLRDNADAPENATSRERASAEEAAVAVLGDLQQATGMIIERGYDAFGFSHLTYQEFFTAEALATMSFDARWSILRPVLHHARWRETTLLCAAHLGVLQVRVDEVDQLVRAMAGAGSEFESLLFRDAFLAADTAAEDVRLSARALNAIATALEAPLGSDLESVKRQAVARTVRLARVGHTASVDRILGWMKTEGDGDTRTLAQEAHSFVAQVLGEATCRPITDWLREQLAVWLDAPAGPISGRYEERRCISSVPYFMKAEPAIRAQILQKIGTGWESWFLFGHLLREMLGTEPEARAALLRLATGSPRHQPALMDLAQSIPEDPEVERLLDDAWSDPQPSIQHAVLCGAIKLAPKHLRWRQRLLEAIENIDSLRSANAINQIGALARTEHDFRAHYVRLMQSSKKDIAVGAASALAPLLKTETSLRREFLLHLERPEAQLRQNAVAHLASLAGTLPEIATALRPRLVDPAPTIRHAALQALAPLALEDAALRDHFIKRLDTLEGCIEPDRIDTVAPLACVDEATRRRIEVSMKAEDRQTRVAALRALGPMAAEIADVRGLLLECLDDSDASVQVVAVDLLRPSITNDAALLTKLLALATNATEDVRQQAVEALAPYHANAAVRAMLLSRVAARQSLGISASKAILELASADPTILARVHDVVTDAEGLRSSGLEWFFNPIDALLVHDNLVCEWICRYTYDETLGPDAWRLLLRHPKLPGVKPVLLNIAKQAEALVRIRALRGLLVLALEDSEARQVLLEMLGDRMVVEYVETFNLDLNVWVDDVAVRRLLLEATKPASDSGLRFQALAPLGLLSGCVIRYPEVEARFREVLLEHNPGDLGGHADAMQAALGLAPIASRDASLRAALLPWLGARTGTGDSLGAALRRALADAFAPVVLEDEAFRQQIIAMLGSTAWQERQGAAWTLIAAGGDILRDALERLRDLLDDDRAEESWVERLHAAASLLNHPEPSLSRKAIDVARDALRYGSEAWHQPLCTQVRQQAARTLGQVQPIRRDAALTSYVVRAIEEEPTEQVRESLYGALLQLASVDDAVSA